MSIRAMVPRRRALLATALGALAVAGIFAGGLGKAFGQNGQLSGHGDRISPTLGRPVELSPRMGAPGTRVTVKASFLPALTPVQVSLGGTHSGFEALALGLTNADGSLEETVVIPDWAQRDRIHRFILFNLYFTAILAESPTFHVTDAEGRALRVGEIGSAATCMILRGDDDEVYRVTGETAGLEDGERVAIEGTLSESEEGCGEGPLLELKLVSVRRTGDS